jgi:peptide subunit release factor 1 (eRF1)
MATELQSALQALTAYPSSEHPVLSIYLDWTPDGNGRRPALQLLEQELDAAAARLAGDAERRPGFEADHARIMEYVNRGAPKEARGLAIFACEAAGIWHALPLQAPVPTEIVIDRYPHAFQLARMIDEYETCAVVLAEGQEARIFVIALDDAEQAGATTASEKIKRFDQGGQAQMLFQRRTENLIKAHTKDIAAQLEQIIQRYDVQHVVIAGNDSIKGALMDSLTNPIRQRLIDYIHLDPTSSLKAIAETIEPLLREAERQQEADDLAELEKQLTAKGGLAAAGLSDIAMALSKGQVSKLLMLQSFAGDGGECPNCGMLRAGQRNKCPYDGADMQPVDLREAFTARAVQQGAALQIVEASDYLAEHDGVGALLRYRDDEQARAVASDTV